MKGVKNMEEFEKNSVPETTSDDSTEISPKKSWKKEVFEWVQAIVIAVLVALLLKNYVLTLAKVQGESMEPTLQDSNRMYVNRLFYTPEKGDVIIFEPKSDPGRPYIKRVIATAGDTIYIDFSTGDVYVNDEIIDEPYIAEPTYLSGFYTDTLALVGMYSRENPIKIEEGYFFAMGDNRNHSKDSRELGPIPLEEVIGHATFRFWPLNEMGNLDHDFSEE